MKKTFACASLALVLAGCGTNMAEVGKPPVMSPVGAGLDQRTTASTYYPQSPAAPLNRSSLWSDRQSTLFTDARALSVGDVLTVFIQINDRAKFKNESDRSRVSSRAMGISGEYEANGVGSGASAGLDFGSSTNSAGSGQTERSENLRLSVAAIVTDVLPNGNLIISGTQEVRVNAELRVLTIAGIVRPSDIAADNSIFYERIAEARISYGGRGRLTEVQQPGWGHQIIDQVAPW